MHILIIGASGRTGTHLISQALSRSHLVTALVRTPSTFHPASVDLSSPLLRITQGTPLNPDDVRTCFSGERVDGVVVALNTTRKDDMPWTKPTSPVHMIATAIRNLLGEMQRSKTKRIVLVSSWGVGSSFPSAPLLVRLLMTYTNLNYTHQALTLAEETLFSAPQGIEWIIARPSGLSDANPEGEGEYRITEDCCGCRWVVSRAVVARFCLDALEKDEWVGRAVVVS